MAAGAILLGREFGQFDELDILVQGTGSVERDRSSYFRVSEWPFSRVLQLFLVRRELKLRDKILPGSDDMRHAQESLEEAAADVENTGVIKIGRHPITSKFEGIKWNPDERIEPNILRFS